MVQQTTDSRQQQFLFGFDSADSRQQTAEEQQQSIGASSSQQTVGKEWQPMKASETHQDEAGGWPEERVQRERLVGGEERTGGRMLRETHKAVRRDAQRENGSIWQKEEVRPGGLEEGSKKEIGPKRQREGSRRGRTLAQAM